MILVTSLIGTLFPVITKRTRRLRRLVPGAVFEFGKFFGSGVILATALIHLLEPAVDAIGEGNTVSAGGCIPDGWAEYPYPVRDILSPFSLVPNTLLFRRGWDVVATLTSVRPVSRLPLLHFRGRTLRLSFRKSLHEET